jgi:RimJ/RimL family protein N-acetyltransferase
MSSFFAPAGEIPVVDTPRLRLRGHRMSDFEHCAAMWADPVVTRYISGRPFTGEEVWARILRYAGHWAWMSYGFWAIEERATGRFIGEAGFADFRREMKPSLEGIPEAGWVLIPSVHGKGYATEAVNGFVSWGDSRFQGARTACLIHPANLASIRVAQKAGYREWTTTAYKGEATAILARG